MLVSEEVCEKLSPTYKKALMQLEDDIFSVTDFDAKEKFFFDFAKKFTTLPEMWIDWIEFVKLTFWDSENLKEKMFLTTTQALLHFYHHYIFNTLTDALQNYLLKYQVWTELLEYPNDVYRYYSNWHEKLYVLKVIENKLSLPSNQLQFYYDIFEEYSNFPMTKEMKKAYKAASVLYQKIIAVDKNDHEKWLSYMKETNNTYFVIQNFELKLGKNGLDKSLWLLYLSFLEENGFYLLKLHAYSRYCRFFVDDLKMLESYHDEIDKLTKLNHTVTKYQIDLIKLHRDFISNESSITLIKKYFNGQLKFNGINYDEQEFLKTIDDIIDADESYELSALHANKEILEIRKCEAMKIQLKSPSKPAFGIPENIILYVLKSSKFKLLQKLYASSKNLYFMVKNPICHRLEIRDLNFTISYQQGLYISTKSVNLKGVNNLYLTNSLDVNSIQDSNVITKILQRIYRCDIQFLCIFGQIISLKEFEFLSQNVKSFQSSDTLIGKRENVSIDDIINRLPKVSKIKVGNFGNDLFLTETTTEKKLLLKKNRINEFFYKNITEIVDEKLLFDFVTQNGNPKSSFTFIFAEEIAVAYTSALKNGVTLRMLRTKNEIAVDIL